MNSISILDLMILMRRALVDNPGSSESLQQKLNDESYFHEPRHALNAAPARLDAIMGDSDLLQNLMVAAKEDGRSNYAAMVSALYPTLANSDLSLIPGDDNEKRLTQWVYPIV